MRHDVALICSLCAGLLARALELVAKIAGDITLTVAKQDRVDRLGGEDEDLGWWKDDTADPRRPATNLAVRVMAERSALEAVTTPARLELAQRHDAAAGELVTWARHILEERGLPAPVRRSHPLAHTVAVIRESLEWLRHRPEADEAFPALLAACGELERIVDTVVIGQPIGLCACGVARYDGERRCSRCRSDEPPAYDKAAIDQAAESAMVTASEAARLIAWSGLATDTPRLRKLIWAWRDRGHLVSDDAGRYRFGDVLRRVLDSPALLRA
jgi:hypothetical protein